VAATFVCFGTLAVHSVLTSCSGATGPSAVVSSFDSIDRSIQHTGACLRREHNEHGQREGLMRANLRGVALAFVSSEIGVNLNQFIASEKLAE
jgi:hypothetical protein